MYSYCYLNHMKLTYIYHSGFVIEGDQCTFIVDYYEDTDDQFVQRNLSLFPGKLYVLVSHWHPDHFNREVLQWKQVRPDIQYVFSNDILRKRLAHAEDADFLMKGQVWEDEFVRIQAFGSTDVGVSFLIEAEDKKIFHAGDLNNWHWSEESTSEEVAVCERHFLKEVDLLTKKTQSLNVAMFPVDPRQGKDYMLGAEQFVDRIQVGLFSPMHFGDNYAAAHAFRSYAEKSGACFADWKTKGEQVEF